MDSASDESQAIRSMDNEHRFAFPGKRQYRRSSFQVLQTVASRLQDLREVCDPPEDKMKSVQIGQVSTWVTASTYQSPLITAVEATAKTQNKNSKRAWCFKPNQSHNQRNSTRRDTALELRSMANASSMSCGSTNRGSFL